MKKYVVLIVDSSLGKSVSGLSIAVRQPGIFNTPEEAEYAVRYDAAMGLVSFVCETSEGWFKDALMGKEKG